MNKQIGTEDRAELQATRREWTGLTLLTLAFMVVVIDVTVLHLAVPKISADLQPSPSQLLWIVDVYAFLVAGTMIPLGTLGDRFGRKRVMLVGAATFAMASILAAFARSATMLIAARALLGIAGAAIAPSTLALIRTMFRNPGEFGKAVSIWSAGATVGAIVGPVIGGVLLQHFWWGSVFLVSVPIMALLVLIGPRVLSEARDPAPGRIDVVSAALSLSGMLAAVYGLKRIAQDGISVLLVTIFIVGVLLIAAFIRRQGRIPYPLVDVALFQSTPFSGALVFGLLGTMVNLADSFLGSQFLQLVAGLSPQASGLSLVPGVLAATMGAISSSKLARKLGEARLASAGYLVVASGLAVVSWAVAERNVPIVIIGHIFLGFGIGPVFPALTGILMRTAPRARAGAASALSQAKDEIGGALGISVLGSIMVFVYRTTLAIPAGADPAAAAAARQSLSEAITRGGDLASAAQDAFVRGYVGVLIVSMAIMAVCAVTARILFRSLATMGEEAEPDGRQ